MNSDFASFVRDLQARVAPLEVEMGTAWWEANIASSPESEERAGNAQKAITLLFADQEAFAQLKQMEGENLTPDEARQHLLLVQAFTGNQMDEAVIAEMVDTERRVESRYNSFRPLLGDEPTGDNALRDILRTSESVPFRREAWEASKAIGVEVAQDVLHLVALRNREAKRLGYAHYYAMSLQLQEQNEAELFALLGDVEAQTNAPFARYKAELDGELAQKFGIPVSQLRPWHYADPFFQEAPPGEVDLDRFFVDKNLEDLTLSYFDNIGLEVRDILARSDLYERENKCQHAFCIHIGRHGDVRVLCNNTPSERWMGTMLHEFGHAVYDKFLGEDLPFFLRSPSHTLTTEAIAMLLGRLSRNAAWLATYAHVSPNEAQTVAYSAHKEQATQLLLLARWVLVMTHFERALYENPDQDLNTLWWQYVQRFQSINPPDTVSVPHWAAKIHLALSPVYYHNYLLGELFASQLQEYIFAHILPPGASEADYVTSPLVGQFLREKVFAPGARLPWNRLVEHATGEPLSPACFVKHMA
jgi:peptidyl-dipeptidase A